MQRSGAEGEKNMSEKEIEVAIKQRSIDISNLRFYSAMAHDFKWGTDVIHQSVISQTLGEIADRLAANSTEPAANQCNCSGSWHDIGGQGCTMKAPAASSVARCPNADDALNWLNEFMGVYQGKPGNSVRFVYSEKNGAWLLDKTEHRWRLSEVLAKYAEQFFSSPSAPQASKPSCHICGEGMDKGFICGKCGAHTGVAQAAPAGLEEAVSSPRSAQPAMDAAREILYPDGKPLEGYGEADVAEVAAIITRHMEPSPRSAEVDEEGRKIAFAKDMNDEWRCWCHGCEWLRKYLGKAALSDQPSPAPEITKILMDAQEKVRPIVEHERQGENVGDLMDFRMKGLGPAETFEWLRQRSNRLIEVEAELAELKARPSQPSEGPQERTKS